VLARGHSIKRVFFFDDGTYNGSSQAIFPQDETDRLQPWLDLSQQHSVELILCISSAIRRGLLDDTEAQRYDKSGSGIHSAFTVSGLGQLVDATAHSDRLVTFGG
jgi:tRNA 2-thiouridine synthesizing protein D